MDASNTKFQFSKKLFAESFGTFSIIFFGCSSIILNEISQGSLGHAGVNLTFGLVVGLLVISLTALSGAHFNPAVTIGLVFLRQFPLKVAPFYIAAQFLGGILGALALKLLFSDLASLSATSPSGSVLQSFSVEVFLTMFLMFAVAVISSKPELSTWKIAVIIGVIIIAAGLIGGTISGASMNPARSFGPALVAGDLTTLWIYMIAPIFGSLLGASIFKIVSLKR